MADPGISANWQYQGRANGCMGDLAPHVVNAVRALAGPIAAVSAQIETVHAVRGGVAVTNDDQVQMICLFVGGAMGNLLIGRVTTGRKMGYAYEIHGTSGAIRFDGEDQNAPWLHEKTGDQTQGFRKILTGPKHPDYAAFCQGPGHGTGFVDQIVIEAKDFLAAVLAGESRWPDLREGMEVNRVVEAAFASSETGTWVQVADF